MNTDDLLLRVQDLEIALKEYYEAISNKYDSMRREVNCLSRKIEKSLEPLFVATDVLNCDKRIKKLSTQIFREREIDADSHSVRLFKALKYLGYSTYGEILDKGESALWPDGYFAKKTMKELKDFLRENGFILKNL